MAKSLLEEIVHKLSLEDQHYVSCYLKGQSFNEEEQMRIANLETAMNQEAARTIKWWNSVFPEVRACGQYFCSTLITNFDVYKQDMQKLLKREVQSYELCQRDDDMMNEVRDAFDKWNNKTDYVYW